METFTISLKREFSSKKHFFSATIAGINGISFASEHLTFDSLNLLGMEVRAHIEKERVKFTDGVQWIIENIPSKRNFYTYLGEETTFASESPLDSDEFLCFEKGYTSTYWKTYSAQKGVLGN